MMFLSLYTILLVLVQVKVNGEENESAELSDTLCTNTYPVAHDRKAPRWKKYGIGQIHNDSATPQTCQDWCSADFRCKSVMYWTNSKNETRCSMFNISVQELKDAGREKEIKNYNGVEASYRKVITYDKACATATSTTTSTTVSSSRPTTTTPTSTVKTTLPSTSASPPFQVLTTSPQTSGDSTTTTEKPDDTTRILIYIIAGVCGLVLTVLVALALLIKKRLLKVNKRLENVESASWISELNGDETVEEESPSPAKQEITCIPEKWPQFCDSNSDKTASPPEYSEDLDTYPSLPSTDTDSPKSLRDVVAQMQ